MSDKELFNEIVKRMCKQYKLDKDYPYEDSFFELTRKSDHEVICGMNPEGYNLLANITELCNQISDWLL